MPRKNAIPYSTKLSIFDLLKLEKEDIKSGTLHLDYDNKPYILVDFNFKELPRITYCDIFHTVKVKGDNFTLEIKPENFTHITLINHSKHLCISVCVDVDKYYSESISGRFEGE